MTGLKSTFPSGWEATLFPRYQKSFILAFRNGFAPVKIFAVLNTAAPAIWGCPHIVTLEERR